MEAIIFERWVSEYFLNPETSILDSKTFLIDIYESDEQYIIEANIEEFNHNQVSVSIHDNKITIAAHSKQNSHPTTRSISFPFCIEQRKHHFELNFPLLTIGIQKTTTLKLI